LARFAAKPSKSSPQDGTLDRPHDFRYVAAYPALQPIIHALGDRGKGTLPEVASTSP
jgi:hypothetical protein